MAEYNYTCGDCLHVQVCEGDPSLRAFDRKNTAYCKALKKVPDVVEVVHCKDCMYAYMPPPKRKDAGWCSWHETEVGNDDFCSFGARRVE